MEALLEVCKNPLPERFPTGFCKQQTSWPVCCNETGVVGNMRLVHNTIQHIKTINHHKKLVMQGCFRLGLYWQGLTHDLSKYTWPELRIGIRYYRDNQSPHNGEREKYGYSTAWLHHKGRNKHHAEYWMDYTADPQLCDRKVTGMRMPVKYVAEMFVDRVSASKNYRKDKYKDSDPLEYYEKRKHYMVIHDDTRKQLEILLHMLADQGEEKTFQYIRRHILKNNYLEQLQQLRNSCLEKLQQLRNSCLEKLQRISEIMHLEQLWQMLKRIRLDKVQN